ncbi:MAG: L-threonylcarbamoyladenylate synthase [Candidatus Nanopelagicus sp.]
MAFDLVEKMRNGALVVFSTENSYVVAADPLNESAVSSFRELKGHDPKTIYPVFVNSIEDLQPFTVDVSDKTRLLTQEFWPGMLNLVLSTRDVPPHNFGSTHSPDRLIARKPKNVLLNLVTELVGPLIYSSLKDDAGSVVRELENISTKQKKRITIAIDNGLIKSSKTTTVLNCMNNLFILEREGSISLWDLKKVVSEIKES